MKQSAKLQRPLRVFLCHSSDDKPIVRTLYHRLIADGFSPWLDEESMLPGQQWDQVISMEMRNSDVVIVCLSRGSIDKKGYVQKEIKYALDFADEQPEGSIYLIPFKLEECPIPERLRRLHCVNYFHENGYEKLKLALTFRAETLLKMTAPGAASINARIAHEATIVEDKQERPHLRSDLSRNGSSAFFKDATSFQIQFRASLLSFQPAKRPLDKDWIDTSFSQSPRAIGELRLPGVSNGRYESKHPILDPDGATVGYMVDGETWLGYTFTCLYAGNCFWIAHQGFGAVMNGVNVSEVSLVDATGAFVFSPRDAKFTVVKSFEFGGLWVHTIRAFKLLDDGNYLLYLTNYGFCLFSTRRREIVAKTEFTNLAHQWSGFALSPKANILAIGFSERGKDPIDDDYFPHRNFVRIYDLKTGVVVGEQVLPGDRETRWIIDFSEDGRRVRATSDLSTHVFELIASA